MRLRTVLLLLSATVVVVLSGCGSGGNIGPRTLTGDYFPTDAGAEWTYRIDVTAWYDSDEADTTGTIDRQVVAVVDTTADELLQTVTYTDFIHAVPAPALAIPAAEPIADYLTYLFAADGGMQSWNEQFALYDTDGDDAANRIRRFAEGPPAGPMEAVADNQPFLHIPLLTGQQAVNSTAFTTVPLFSNNPTLTNRHSVLGVQYRDAQGFLGQDPHPYAYVSQALEATVNFNGRTGTCDGYCKTSLARDIGPVEKDIDLEFRLGGPWLRVHAMIRVTRYRILAP